MDGFEITNQSDLYARLPLGAASLQAEVSSGNSLKLNYLATGQRVAKAPLSKLEGECASATHYVRAITVGAYSLDAMSSGSAGAGGGIGGIGGGAGRKETVQRLRAQGDVDQCRITGLATKGCDAPLQLELAPIAAAPAYAPLPPAEGAGTARPAPGPYSPPTAGAPSVDDLERLKEEAKVIQQAADAAKAKADAQERKRNEAEAKAKAEYPAQLEKGWKAASETANMTAVAANTRIGAVQAFLDRFKKDNPHETEAKECIRNIKSDSSAGCSGSARCAQRSSDGRFCDHGNETITDTQTCLTWAKADSYASLGKCLDWNDARSYVASLRTGGHTDWRMPSVDESKGLYEPAKNLIGYDAVPKVPLHIDPVFARGGAYIFWSIEESGWFFARLVSFYNGDVLEGSRAHCSNHGVRAVRRGQ